MFEKVLIPTDLSEPSEYIIKRAAGLKNIREIILLHLLDGNEQRNVRRGVGPAPVSRAGAAQEKLKPAAGTDPGQDHLRQVRDDGEHRGRHS